MPPGPAPGRPRRVEHEYDRAGASQDLAARDARRHQDFAQVVAIDPFNRIVVAGTAYNRARYDVLVAWYLPDGALAPTFATGGLVTTPFDGPDDGAAAVALDLAGRILAAGAGGTTSSPGVPSTFEFAIARYHGDTYPHARTGRGDLVGWASGTWAENWRAAE